MLRKFSIKCVLYLQHWHMCHDATVAQLCFFRLQCRALFREKSLKNQNYIDMIIFQQQKLNGRFIMRRKCQAADFQVFKCNHTFRWLLLALGKNYRLGTAHELISSDCLNQLICMRTCNAESQKRSAKGANFKRRQQGFAPLGVITPCLICSLKFNVLCWSKFFGDSGSSLQ